jgi:hypothetical protein
MRIQDVGEKTIHGLDQLLEDSLLRNAKIMKFKHLVDKPVSERLEFRLERPIKPERN